MRYPGRMFDALRRKLHHRNWPEVLAEVERCGFHSDYAGRALDPGEVPWYSVDFTYKVNGMSYDGGLISEVEVKPHDRFPIRYDPKNPAHNSTDPLPHWTEWYALVSYGTIGGFLLWYALRH